MGEGEKKRKYISEIAIFTYPKIRQPQMVLISGTQVEVKQCCVCTCRLNDRAVTE